jgi:8-oxo-dGTP pyrophosphatase MutT (NUDIX family)
MACRKAPCGLPAGLDALRGPGKLECPAAYPKLLHVRNIGAAMTCNAYTPSVQRLLTLKCCIYALCPIMSSIWKTSATVATVIERDGRFLLVEEHTHDGLRLNQPAGHLDANESLIEAAARETLEETAYAFRPTAWLGCYLGRFRSSRSQEDVTYTRFTFVGELGAFDPDRALDEGIVRTVWMTADELRACPERHRSPLVMVCVDDYLTGRRLPLEALYTHPSVLTAGELV